MRIQKKIAFFMLATMILISGCQSIGSQPKISNSDRSEISTKSEIVYSISYEDYRNILAAFNALLDTSNRDHISKHQDLYPAVPKQNEMRILLSEKQIKTLLQTCYFATALAEKTENEGKLTYYPDLKGVKIRKYQLIK